LIERRGRPGLIVSDNGADPERHTRVVRRAANTVALHRAGKAAAERKYDNGLRSGDLGIIRTASHWAGDARSIMVASFQRLARRCVLEGGAPRHRRVQLGEYTERLEKKVDVPENEVFLDRASFSDTGSVDGPVLPTAVAEHIAAPPHQHSFNFRIDFEVDLARTTA
jgi:hypothetical protein